MEVELAEAALPGQVAEAANVTTVNPARRTVAQGAAGDRGAGADGDAVGGVVTRSTARPTGSKDNSDLNTEKDSNQRGQRAPHVLIPAPQPSPAAPKMRKDRFCMSPDMGKLKRAVYEFAVYIASNVGSLINYGERFRWANASPHAWPRAR